MNMHSFKNFWTKKNFGRDIYNGTNTLKEADKDQSSLFVKIINGMNKEWTGMNRTNKEWNGNK